MKGPASAGLFFVRPARAHSWRCKSSRELTTASEVKRNCGRVFERTFLGYSFGRLPEGAVRRRLAPKALARLKDHVHSLTRRTRGRSIHQMATELRSYLLGWKAYFRLARMPRVFGELDAWIRQWLRLLHLVLWKRGRTAYPALLAVGASPVVAGTIAANLRRWWRNSGMLLNAVLPIAYFDRLGIPRLS